MYLNTIWIILYKNQIFSIKRYAKGKQNFFEKKAYLETLSIRATFNTYFVALRVYCLSLK